MEDDIWPDPGDWVARLNARLITLDTQYYGFNLIRRMKADPDEVDNPEVVEDDPQASATLAAAGALAAVVGALKEIPSFRGNVGLQALTDLGNALLDLDKGLKPPMLRPRPGGASVKDYSGRRFLKAHVVLCIELLELSGQDPSTAQEAIIDIFSAAGFGGRKRVQKGGTGTARLPSTTIDDWRSALSRQGADADGRSIIDRAISDWKAKRSWPPRTEDVMEFARDRANDPALHTTI